MDTDRTQVKGSHSDLPVAGPSPSVRDGHQCARALVAGEGRGGQARIWAPDMWAEWTVCGVAGLWTAATLARAVAGVMHGDWGHFALYSTYTLLVGCFFAFIFVRALRESRYVSADASGIAIATESGKVAVSWNDIRRIRRIGERIQLGVKSPRGPIDLDLSLYLEPSRGALVQLIIERSELYPHPLDSRQFLTLEEMARCGLQPGALNTQSLGALILGDMAWIETSQAS